MRRSLTLLVVFGLLCFAGVAEAQGRGRGGGNSGNGNGNGGSASAPEIDPSALASGAALVAGGLAVIAERRRRRAR